MDTLIAGMNQMTQNINRLVEVQAAVQSTKGEGKGVQNVMGKLDERYFRRVEKFAGEERAWREFSFSFRTAVGMGSMKARQVLEELEREDEEPSEWEAYGDAHGEEERWGGEVYANLSQLVSGESMTILQSVGTGNGWAAWWRLARRFDPRTPARALRAMMLAMQPKKVKDIRELPRAVEEWEMRVSNLLKDHNLKLDDQIKTALLTSMLPVDFQDSVFQWTDNKMDYKEMKDKIMAMALNKASLAKPVPMDVSQVASNNHWDNPSVWDYSYEGNQNYDLNGADDYNYNYNHNDFNQGEDDGEKAEIDYIGERLSLIHI